MSRARDLLERLVTKGIAEIDNLIADRACEELFLDFKRSSDNGNGAKLSQNDRNNLGKAISGFGNSEGGVLIWGVDCSPGQDGADVAKMKVPVTDVRRFVSWLQGAVSGCTVPPHGGVTHHPLADSDGNGYVVTYIPKSNAAPHQVVGKSAYYVRAGSDFVPAPHGVLAGLFGRVPQPAVFHRFLIGPARHEQGAVEGEIGFLVFNEGPGVANDLFLNVTLRGNPGHNCKIAIERTDAANWSGAMSLGFRMSLISQPAYRLPPEAECQPAILHYRLAPPFSGTLKVGILVGAGNSLPVRYRSERNSQQLQDLFDQFLLAYQDPEQRSEASRNFGSLLLDGPDKRGAESD